MPEQIANAFHGDISGAKFGDVLRVYRVMSLARKHGGQPLAHDILHRLQDAQLVVDHDVMLRRVMFDHGVQHLFLVDINKHAAFDGIPKAGTLHLARLEHDVAVRQHHGRAETAQVRDDVACLHPYAADLHLFVVATEELGRLPSTGLA